MGPVAKQEIPPNVTRSPAGDGEETQSGAGDFEEKFTIEHLGKGVTSPLESTHLNGSFQAVWPETFDLPTIHEDQFEDYGEVESPNLQRRSPARGLGSWRSSCDLSGLDGEGSCSSCSETSEKLSFLEDRLSEMEGESLKQEETARRQRNVSKRLVKRINSLEEHLELEKMASEEALQKLRTLHEVALQKAERTRELQVENLNSSVHALKDENAYMSRKISALSTQNRALEKKVQSLEDDIMDMQDSLQRLHEHAQKLEETLMQERIARDTEKEVMSQVIDGLRNQLVDVWDQEDEALRPVQRPPKKDVVVQTYSDDSVKELDPMVQENLRLQAEIEELQEALSAQGRALLWQQNGDPRPPAPGSDFCSLVDEMELASREQVQALQEQKDINKHLRQYLDRVILTILEKDPTLLEVKKPAM
ncbi:rab11 family-interacting protein 4B-like isoform X2 [Pleurodeles waltl]|uniref:rab11 family-interacting protein 4B-like isoform X2 n=1 Tax=Pleurodeles waltl TaxID=8319 RepID=UPI003709565C